MRLKRPFEKIAGLLTGLALIMILSQTTGVSLAYFTTYATASGGHTIEYKTAGTEIHEQFDDWVKTISIENTGSVPCYVRIKVLAGEQFTLNYTDPSGKWSLGSDGYWYYRDILPVGGLTETLSAAITVPESLASSFNVVVVQESVPVSYREDGTPYGNWSLKREAAAE